MSNNKEIISKDRMYRFEWNSEEQISNFIPAKENQEKDKKVIDKQKEKN